MIQANDLTGEIREVLKGEKYGLEARQITRKLEGKVDLQEGTSRSKSMMITRLCREDPYIVKMNGYVSRYRLVTKGELEARTRRFDELFGKEEGK